MKKAFDQTFRDIKREVNKKVLKVPSVEQKVLDATSNEPWGPHGALLADIAQRSKNYHDYQMIMAVIWKRINDTGKNWRHVYKALTVLEYLVANGSERVIDEIREHSYQIQTLSDFQYIDSSGRDQGNNVRKKSQSLVVLVNDKERITEVRQKAAANRDKYRNTTGSMYRPGSYPNAGGYGGYDDDRYEGRYGGKDEDRNGYGREREWGNRDDDVYGRNGDSYSRDADKYGRDYEDRYSRDGYRDDDYRGRSQSTDYNQYGSRSRSSDRYRDRGYEDDGQYSSRGSGVRADDQSLDGSTAGRRLERKFSEQNLGAPPSYEEAVGVARSPTHSEQDRDLPPLSAPKSSSPPASSSPIQAVTAVAPAPAPASPPTSASSPPAPAPAPAPPSPPTVETKDVDSFDEFDPRSSFPAVPATSHASGPTNLGGAEMDLLGSLSDSFPTNSLALVPAASAAFETDASANSSSGPAFASSVPPNQTFDDPFGDGPFKAIPSMDSLPAQPQNIPSVSSSHQPFNQTSEGTQQTFPEGQAVNSSGDAFPGATYSSPNAVNVQPPANMQFLQHESSTLSPEIDILADILPLTGGSPPADLQESHPTPAGHPLPQVGFPPQDVQTASETGFPSQPGLTSASPSFPSQLGQPVGLTNFPAQPGQPPAQANFQAQPGQLVPQNFYAQMSQPASLTGFPAQAGQPSHPGFPSQASQPLHPGFPSQASQPSHPGFPSQASQPSSVGGFPSQMVSSAQAGFHSQSHQHSTSYGGYNAHMVNTGSVTPPMTSQVSNSPTLQNNSANFLPQSSSSTPASSHMNLLSPHHAPAVSQSITSSSTALATVPQQGKDKFETKSTVWADTLSRGLVNLNISGPKINPLADIGVDFDAINRKEKRMEKPTTAPVTSTITMGKAMGSGSGIGRAGAGVMRPAQNQMMGGSGMGMGMGMGMGAGAGAGPGMGMGGYGAVNQPIGMNMNPNMAMGMGMGMGMGQGPQMQRPMGYHHPPGGYNPMMGPGNYSEQPYGGGYR